MEKGKGVGNGAGKEGGGQRRAEGNGGGKERRGEWRRKGVYFEKKQQHYPIQPAPHLPSSTNSSKQTTMASMETVLGCVGPSPFQILAGQRILKRNTTAHDLGGIACPPYRTKHCRWKCYEESASPSWSDKPGRFILARCQKMFVPGFAEQSPEARAAANLHNFFTYIAVKIVLAQLEDYNREAYEELMEFASRTSLNDGDKFCAALMRESPRHKGLALRILEVRSAYVRQDFEWENLKLLAIKIMGKSNTSLMREFLVETSNME